MPSRDGGEHHGRDGRDPGRQSRRGRCHVLKFDRRNDRQGDHYRLEEQHRGAEPAHRSIPPENSSLASPAVTTEPVISTKGPAVDISEPSSPPIRSANAPPSGL